MGSNQTDNIAALNDQEMVIVCGADDKFAMPLAITLYSALVNLREDKVPNLYIIDGGVRKESKQKIEAVLTNAKKGFKLTWIPFDLSKINAVVSTEILSKATYLRILIPDLLPSTHKKAIYLDCDMIVEADLSILWEIGFNDEPAMGVPDFCSPYISMVDAITKLNSPAIPGKNVYCNSGLLVFNLDYWRKHNLKASIFNFLANNHSKSTLFDQDGINVILDGKWKLLDPRWNVTLSSLVTFGNGLSLTDKEIEDYKINFRNAPYIIHFTSRYKPWHTGKNNREALNSYYYDQYFISRFYFYLKKSKWFSPAVYTYWISYRKAILLFQYKIPRRFHLIRKPKKAVNSQ